jgi:hypothetical protein
MQRNLPIILLVMSLSLLLHVGCGSDKPKEKPIPPEQLVAKSWKLNKLEMDGQLTGPEIMANASLTFYKNGRYEILMGDLERGKWSLSADKKVLITQEDGAEVTGEMDIVKLAPNLMILTNTGNAKPMTMELVPM